MNDKVHKWFGVPFADLSPVQRANAMFFIEQCGTLQPKQKTAALTALRASGQLATRDEVDREIQKCLAAKGLV